MTVERKNGYIEIKADEGKALKIEDRVFHGGAFPTDFDTSIIEEIDEPIEQEVEEDE